MKLSYAYRMPIEDVVEAPAPKAPVRGRNDKTDELLRKVNGSPRYGVTSLLEQTQRALARRKA